MMSKKAEERRKQILKASFRAVADKGYDAVTLQDIADYAEVSKGVTNYYFKNKEDVFAHLLDWITKRIYHNETISIKNEDTALDKLQAYIHTVFISPEENRNFYRVYLDFLAQVKNNSRYQEINNSFYENCWNIGSEIVSLGVQEGVFRIEDTRKAAITIRCMIDGFLIQWLMRDEDELHNYYRETCYNAIVRYLTSKW